ncbi:MAG: NAD(P)-dependent alcohol dehydrogenase [Actinobacteria bacterium]|nr:NAD(P)-dependent alcohol dehydrogenase [Actinomycetota bacterium]
MLVIEQRGYGDPRDVLHPNDHPIPPVADDELLVRNHASSANAADWRLVCGEPLALRPALGGLRGPRRVAGSDFAGVVEQVGAQVTGFTPGDRVYGNAPGAFAEYVAAPAARTAHMPNSTTFAQAGAVPLAGIAALQGLRSGAVTAGQQVMILGASGGVGSFAVQIARHAGAEVTGVCSTGALDHVRRLGAAHLIDYTVEDPTEGPARYDLILQLGGRYPVRQLRRRLQPRGVLVQSMGDGGRWFGPLGAMTRAAVVNLVVKQRLTALVAKESAADLEELSGLLDSGAVRPVIDSEVSLTQAADALERVRHGHPRGKVVVSITE